MGRRPKITLKVKDCQTCSNKAGCFLCINKSEWEEEPDIRKELKGHPSERDMEAIGNPTTLSSCCHAPMNVGGLPDFPKDDKPTTCYYKCSKCGMPCDISNPSILQELMDIVKSPKRVKSKRKNK